MTTQAGLRGQGAGRGFTLIEVLLATVLLLLLLGALVFGFHALERGARLNEGASQFEALLRFARAHAESTGRQVQILFEEEIEPTVSLPLDAIRVTWEPDPLGRPGVFEDVAEMKPYTERINELIRVHSLSLLGPEHATADADTEESGEAWLDEFDLADFLPPLRFYPDGSSDSAEITLASREEEDTRKVRVRLLGLTGVIQRSVFEAESLAGEEEALEEPQAADQPTDAVRPQPPSSPRPVVDNPTP